MKKTKRPIRQSGDKTSPKEALKNIPLKKGKKPFRKTVPVNRKKYVQSLMEAQRTETDDIVQGLGKRLKGVCIACGGTGTSSKGSDCVPCKGSGKRK